MCYTSLKSLKIDRHGYINGYINGYANGYIKKRWLQLASVAKPLYKQRHFQKLEDFITENGKVQGIS